MLFEKGSVESTHKVPTSHYLHISQAPQDTSHTTVPAVSHCRADCGAVSHFRCSPILLFHLALRPALIAIKSLDEPLSHAAILAVSAVSAVVPVEVGTRYSAVVGTRDSARDGIQALSTALRSALRTARPLGRDRIRLQQEEVEAEDGTPLGIMPFPIVAQRS
jgi:hypothetical protein